MLHQLRCNVNVIVLGIPGCNVNVVVEDNEKWSGFRLTFHLPYPTLFLIICSNIKLWDFFYMKSIKCISASFNLTLNMELLENETNFGRNMHKTWKSWRPSFVRLFFFLGMWNFIHILDNVLKICGTRFGGNVLHLPH